MCVSGVGVASAASADVSTHYACGIGDERRRGGEGFAAPPRYAYDSVPYAYNTARAGCYCPANFLLTAL